MDGCLGWMAGMDGWGLDIEGGENHDGGGLVSLREPKQL
jgi:hypothetical protein